MKLIRQSPLLSLILSLGFLFTLLALLGRGTVYGELSYAPLEAPLLSLVFTGIKEEIYPWQLWQNQNLNEGPQKETAAPAKAPTEAPSKAPAEILAETGNPAETEEEIKARIPVEKAEETAEETKAKIPAETAEETKTGTSAETETETPMEITQEATGSPAETAADIQAKIPAAAPAAIPTLAPTPSPTPYVYGEGRMEPLRASSEDEYLHHISADIYGDAGVRNAAAYEFGTVDESYFDDAMFIGDSRTVGLRDYTDLSEHADFYCETSLTVYKALEKSFKNRGTIEEALRSRKYGKIYLMIGINELGRGTTEDFMAKYTEVVDTLHAWAPDAKIIIQGIMRVARGKSEKDKIFNNTNIIARNNAIATLADNESVFYIDVNEAVCGEDGYLMDEYTFDQIHLLGRYNEVWKQFLFTHGVE